MTDLETEIYNICWWVLKYECDDQRLDIFKIPTTDLNKAIADLTKASPEITERAKLNIANGTKQRKLPCKPKP